MKTTVFSRVEPLLQNFIACEQAPRKAGAYKTRSAEEVDLRRRRQIEKEKNVKLGN